MIQNKLGRGAGSKENHREKKETYLHMIQTQELSEDFKITMTYIVQNERKNDEENTWENREFISKRI